MRRRGAADRGREISEGVHRRFQHRHHLAAESGGDRIRLVAGECEVAAKRADGGACREADVKGRAFVGGDARRIADAVRGDLESARGRNSHWTFQPSSGEREALHGGGVAVVGREGGQAGGRARDERLHDVHPPDPVVSVVGDVEQSIAAECDAPRGVEAHVSASSIRKGPAGTAARDGQHGAIRGNPTDGVVRAVRDEEFAARVHGETARVVETRGGAGSIGIARDAASHGAQGTAGGDFLNEIAARAGDIDRAVFRDPHTLGGREGATCDGDGGDRRVAEVDLADEVVPLVRHVEEAAARMESVRSIEAGTGPRGIAGAAAVGSGVHDGRVREIRLRPIDGSLRGVIRRVLVHITQDPVRLDRHIQIAGGGIDGGGDRRER